MNQTYNVSPDMEKAMNLSPWMFNEFSKIMYHLAQQKQSRVASQMQHTTYEGRSTTVQSQEPTSVQERPPHSKRMTEETPNMGIDRDRRWIKSKLFEWGKLYDKPEELKSIIDPQSGDLQAAKYAFARQYDDEALKAFDADVEVGEYESSGTVSFPTSQVLNDDLSATFGVDALIQMWEMFGENEVDISDPSNQLFLTLRQRELSMLMNSDKYQNIQYNNQKVLTTGQANNFMGFNFIHTERVPTISGSPDKAKLFAWAKSGMIFAEQAGARVSRIGERADRRFNIQVYEGRSGGATRLEEKKVIRYTVPKSSTSNKSEDKSTDKKAEDKSESKKSK